MRLSTKSYYETFLWISTFVMTCLLDTTYGLIYGVSLSLMYVVYKVVKLNSKTKAWQWELCNLTKVDIHRKETYDGILKF